MMRRFVGNGELMRQRATVVLGLVISAVLIGVVLASVDLERVRDALSGARYGYVFPAMALLAIGLLTRAIRWRVLLNERLPLGHAFHILNISYLINGALPFRLGELGRIFLAARVPQALPVFTTLSTILVERLLDLLVVTGMLGLVLALLDMPDYVAGAGRALGLGALGGLLILALLARRPGWPFRLVERLQQMLPVLSRWHLQDALSRFVDGLAPLSERRGLTLAVLWSLVSWALSVVAGYVLLYAFFPAGSWITTLLFIALASLAVSVPYAPGAVGPYEAGVVLALNLTGYNQPEGAAIAFAIVLHVVTTGVFVVMGTLGLLQQGISLGQVMRGARGMNGAGVTSVPGSME